MATEYGQNQENRCMIVRAMCSPVIVSLESVKTRFGFLAAVKTKFGQPFYGPSPSMPDSAP